MSTIIIEPSYNRMKIGLLLLLPLFMSIGCSSRKTETAGQEPTMYADTSSTEDVSGDDPLASSYSTDNKSILVDYSMAGSKWPFRDIYTGRVECIDGMYVVFKTRAGIYAINGTAKTAAADKGWKNTDEIQIRGKSIGPILDAGVKLCQ